MNDKLPDNVIQLTTLSINYNKRKNCECLDSWPRKDPSYEVDYQNREVICKHCGVIVDPFEAIYNISKYYQKLQDETQRLLEQARALSKYKPWLRSIKEIESNVRSGRMIPSCPHCHQGILLDEITGYVDKDMELQRRKFRKVDE